jgi:DNA (cytosine-5)-methyltransferase 1
MNSYIVGDSSLGDIRQRLEGKSTGFQTYIIKDRDVCNTLIAGSNDFIRPEHNNINLSDYELKQIGSWSLDYDFKNQKVIYVLGMSVPPLAMYRISKEIQTQWLDRLNK